MKGLSLLFYSVMIIFTITCSHVHTLDLNKETVISLHGFGRSELAVRTLASKIRMNGFNVVPIEYKSLNQNIDEIRVEVYEKINSTLLKHPKEKIHFVGHSLGGLLVRSYLDNYKIEGLANVVIMGSPNKGTSFVDFFKDKCYFSLAGPAAISLSANSSQFLTNLKRPYYNLGVIASIKEYPKYEYILPGPDDGLVTAESAKVESMNDFVSINVSHAQMRYDSKVAAQVIHFLKKGSFDKRRMSRHKILRN